MHKGEFDTNSVQRCAQVSFYFLKYQQLNKHPKNVRKCVMCTTCLVKKCVFMHKGVHRFCFTSISINKEQ